MNRISASFILRIITLTTVACHIPYTDKPFCGENIGYDCKGLEGWVLCCEPNGMVYCEWQSSTYTYAPCPDEFPSCSTVDGGQVCHQGQGATTLGAYRVSNTGDVMDGANCIEWNIYNGRVLLDC